jgi:hypothetical protein
MIILSLFLLALLLPLLDSAVLYRASLPTPAT